MDAREVIKAFYNDIWNRHDKSVIPELLAKEFSFRGSLGQLKRGYDGFAEYVDFVHAALDDYHCEIQDLLVDGDKVFARMLFSGRHRGEFFGFAPTGKQVQWAGAALFSFESGRVSDLWVLGDLHGLIAQLERNQTDAT